VRGFVIFPELDVVVRGLGPCDELCPAEVGNGLMLVGRCLLLLED
jgi:hypothetical protein